MDLSTSALLRVLDGRMRPVGVAFVVDTSDGPRVLTCEHVLDGAVFSTVDGAHRVEVEPVAVFAADDLAVLRPGALPDGVTPLPLLPVPPAWGTPVRCFGFPAGYDDGVWATGSVLGRQARGLLVVEDDRVAGFAVAPGFSGGPAWDPVAGGVVGVVVQVAGRASARTAFLLSSTAVIARLPPRTPGANPYRGLRPFRFEDSGRFFGRDGMADDLAAKVRAERVVALVGPSGRGKSSLVFAGVLPRLGDLPVVVWRPGDPVPATAADALVVVDQAEELVGSSDDAFAALARGAAGKLLVALRSDFLEPALDHPDLARVLRSCDTLGVLTREQLLSAITGPLPVDVRLEKGLAGRIARDVEHAPGQLSLLQFTLERLWDRQVAGVLTHAAYEQLGEAGGALAHYAEDEVWSRLPEAERAVAPRLFSRLVRVTHDLPTTRAAATAADLTGPERGLADRLLAAGLLVGGRDGTVELAHEALITLWHRLRESVEQDREFELWRAELRRDRARWGATPTDKVLRAGGGAAHAARWLADREHDLPDDERLFARRAADARRAHDRRWHRRAAVVLVIALVVGLPYAALSLLVDDDRGAPTVFRGDYHLAPDLSDEALWEVLTRYRDRPDVDTARHNLFAAYLRTRRVAWTVPDPGGRGTGPVLAAPDGSFVAVGTRSGALLWSVGAPAPVVVHTGGRVAGIDPDGSGVTFADEDGVRFVHRDGTPAGGFVVPGGPGAVVAAPAPDRVATWRSGDSQVLLWHRDGTPAGAVPLGGSRTDVGFHLVAGNRLLVHQRGDDPRLYLVDLATGGSALLGTGRVAVAVNAAGTVATTCRRVGSAAGSPVSTAVFALPSGDRVAEFTGPHPQCAEVLAPDGRTALHADPPTLVDLATGTATAVLRADQEPQALVTGPDGRLLVVGRSASTVVAEYLSPDELADSAAPVRAAHFSRDGHRVLTVHRRDRDDELALWRTSDQRRQAVARTDGNVDTAWLSPSGQYVAVGFTDRARVEVRSAADLALVAALPLEGARGFPVLRFDERDRLHVGHSAAITTWEPTGTAPPRRVAVPADRHGEVRFDLLADDRAVVVTADREGVREWDLTTGRAGPGQSHRGLPVLDVAAPGGVLVVVRDGGPRSYVELWSDAPPLWLLLGEDEGREKSVRARMDASGGHLRWISSSALAEIDGDGTVVYQELKLPVRAEALRGSTVLLEDGPAVVDERLWQERLCDLVRRGATRACP
ncbi:hypothetical protein AB0I60_01520 [Actinosynnema sp. NPDC050436]|uniref:nSTAND1 domain-containing NTPase n=1 Tax=Actinosynnema sp. NPDC050436 TaxID=3155659 RepID=UPI0033D43784